MLKCYLLLCRGFKNQRKISTPFQQPSQARVAKLLISSRACVQSDRGTPFSPIRLREPGAALAAKIPCPALCIKKEPIQNRFFYRG